MEKKQLTQEQREELSMNKFLDILEEARYSREIGRARYMPDARPHNYIPNSCVVTEHVLFWEFKKGNRDWSNYTKILDNLA